MFPAARNHDVTLQQLIDTGAAQFDDAALWFGHGTDNAWDEAAWMAASVMVLPLPLEPASLQMPVTPEQQQSIKDLYTRRINTRQPAAYLLNEAWFCGLCFYVDERVLIPRSPVGELILDEFTPWTNPRKVHRILDIGTGSGCIAIACAVHLPQAEIVATDISEDALDVARINVERYGLQQRVTLLRSDLFSDLPEQAPFDVIISNPPYVSTERTKSLPAEYQHEPHLGLYSGASGLDHAAVILQQAHEYLSDEGILVLEVGESQDALQKRFPNLSFNWVEFEHGGEGVCVLAKPQLGSESNFH